MEVTGNSGTSVAAPFVLTPSGSCQPNLLIRLEPGEPERCAAASGQKRTAGGGPSQVSGGFSTLQSQGPLASGAPRKEICPDRTC